MAEILVRGHDSWLDTLTQEQVNALSESELASYNARQKKGDIIAAKADNAEWKIPKSIIVKVADMTVAEAEALIGSNISDTDIVDGNLIVVNKTKAEVEALTGGE